MLALISYNVIQISNCNVQCYHFFGSSIGATRGVEGGAYYANEGNAHIIQRGGGAYYANEASDKIHVQDLP